MSWASRRQFIVISLLAAIAIAVIASVAIAIFYETPTCSDKKQNQDEAGIDCGGSCARVCTADSLAPQVTFARPVSPLQGRTDVIAYVVNPNAEAAVNDARFTIELYGNDGIVIAKKEGTVDLGPGDTVPVFMPNLYTGNLIATRAFLTFDPASLVYVKYQDRRIIPRYNDDAHVVSGSAPRITASFSNPSAMMLRNIPVVATVFDADGSAIAATQTLLTELPPQGNAQVIFVWNEPFAAPPARVDIAPLVSL
jgi:hypothetical protein